MLEALLNIFNSDWQSSLLIVLNLIVIESLLSVDNAAVLATMVMDLPEAQRSKALKYGIIGAYVFRGISLLLVSYLIQVLWLKAVGGAYLLFICFNYFRTKATPGTGDDSLNKNESKYYKFFLKLLGGPFWATVIFVEVMDLAFSIDNVFAAVAFTDNIILICTGVFIGILTMRFVAQFFVKLIEKFHFLESVAFIVIGILGLKLVASYACDFFKSDALCIFLNGHEADLYVSLITIVVFVLPMVTCLLFNFPKKNDVKVETEKEKVLS
jgi:YkoY family integral membrane protein